jgi:hypothetical protein
LAGLGQQSLVTKPDQVAKTSTATVLLRLRGQGLTIREIIAEQRRRLCSANPAERLAAALLIPNLLRERLNELADRQIGQLLENEVWTNLNLLAPESTICLVAADRLRRHVSRQPKRNKSEGGN